MKFVIVIVGLLLSFQSKAEWVLLNQRDFGLAGIVSSYIRKSPIISDGNLRRYWVLSDSQVRSAISGGLSTVLLYESDCTNLRTRVLQTIDYAGSMATGNQVDIKPNPQPWIYVAPNSFSENLLLMVCSVNK